MEEINKELEGDIIKEKNKMEVEKKKKEPTTIKMRKNPWMVATIVLGILAILLIAGNIMKVKTEVLSENERLCKTISGTPAWAKDGKIVSYGTVIPENQSIDLVRTVLIPERIKFLYNPNCSHCEAQIDYFKSQNIWDIYVKENLTVDCSKYW